MRDTLSSIILSGKLSIFDISVLFNFKIFNPFKLSIVSVDEIPVNDKFNSEPNVIEPSDFQDIGANLLFPNWAGPWDRPKNANFNEKLSGKRNVISSPVIFNVLVQGPGTQDRPKNANLNEKLNEKPNVISSPVIFKVLMQFLCPSWAGP